MYRNRKITIRKAAELLNLSYVETYDLIASKEIDIGYSIEDLRKDLN